ncbi:ThiS family protein [Caloramator mitchellensis]|uniref:ThiS family protein n=1 Tax=Caloramator mitchellensis TaxID=908809 RepID=A0A0R3JUL7_CALMK|nr:MoaD/ThiS family protein [Caloramator mitchellensis]KRQ87257.1 ThiS family protein [Caloramator mitchellensis]
MKVTVKLFAMLSKFTKNNAVIELEVDDSTTIKDILIKIGIPEDEVFNCTINGKNSELNETIKNGDTVGFYPYLGGG